MPNKDDVARAVRKRAAEFVAGGGSTNPLLLYTEMAKEGHWAISHIRRYHRGDPYQQLKVYLGPEWR